MENGTITVIDETIREGMQYRGVVFSQKQKETILEFQEQLGVDICQAGYAPAHISEQKNISYLNQIVREKGYKIRIAGMGRASIHDIDALIDTGIIDFHLHANIKSSTKTEKEREIGNKKCDIQQSLEKIREVVEKIRKRFKDSPQATSPRSALNSESNYGIIPTISIAVLDIGTSSPKLLSRVSSFLVNELAVEILSLPDTSGIMSPDTFYDAIKSIALSTRSLTNTISTNGLSHSSQIAVHCHNDLGMASANTVMGVKAGATVVEVSALGIGERNGIGDMFTVLKILNNQGYNFRVRIEDIETFKKYYHYVSDICKIQTQEPLLNYNTPFFGDGVKTHVAGTHANSGFGLFDKEEYYLNVLCGKRLVKQYLESINIPFLPEQISKITEQIKSKSAIAGRRLEEKEVIDIIRFI